MQENEENPGVGEFIQVELRSGPPIEFQLFEDAAECEQDQGEPLEGGEPLVEDELREGSELIINCDLRVNFNSPGKALQ